MTNEQFLHKLREHMADREGLLFSVCDSKPCAEFEIRSPVKNTAYVKGYYCEAGDSFIQVSFSGREELTNDESSAKRFLDLIEEILSVLTDHGCLEKQWTASDGKVKRSTMDFHLPKSGVSYSLGKAPHFWQKGLTFGAKKFLPFLKTKEPAEQ
jgi:hypothetical protein